MLRSPESVEEEGILFISLLSLHFQEDEVPLPYYLL